MDELQRTLCLLVNQYSPGTLTLEAAQKLVEDLRAVILKPELLAGFSPAKEEPLDTKGKK